MNGFVFRVVDQNDQPLKVRKAGNSKPTITTYNDGGVAARVANSRNKLLGKDMYRVQASRVEWHDYDVLTQEMIA
jgi:hypothetical protein